MMECYNKNNLFHKGVKVYQQISRTLNTELRITPNAELTALNRTMLTDWTQSCTDEPEAETQKIIGRTEEIELLHKSYRSFLMGNPTAIYVLGDNGVGKSHLLNHFLNSIDGDSCIVLSTICFKAETDFTLQPWNSIMMQLDNYVTANSINLPANFVNNVSSLFPLFGDCAATSHLPEDINTAANYRTIRNSILKLFDIVGDTNPIILFFDNIQFMDNLSLELLSLIIREQSPNIMCVATCLNVFPTKIKKHVSTLMREKFLSQITLKPFTRDDVAMIVNERLGEQKLDSSVIDLVYKDTEGNAFFLDMLLGYLSADANDKTKISTLPQDILLERVEELSTASRQLLDTISVCLNHTTLGIIEFIFNRDTLEIIEIIDDLKQHCLIEEKVYKNEVRFNFRHAKMQDFVHSLLSPSKRRLLHARVAEYLETANLPHNNAWYQSLIYHYSLSGNEARVLACKIFNLSDFSRHNYELYPILSPLQDSTEQAPVHITEYFDELCIELERLHNYQPTAAVNFSELEARLNLQIGKYYISQGKYEKGVSIIKDTVASNEYIKQTPVMQIYYLRQLTFHCIQVCDTSNMNENIEKNLSIASEHHLSVEYAIECRLFGLYLLMCGNYSESKKSLEKAINLFQTTTLNGQSYGLNVAACYNYLGEAERRQSNFKKSIHYYEKAINICAVRKCHDNPTFYTNMGQSLFAMGEYEHCLEVFKTAAMLYEGCSIIVGRSISKSYLCVLTAMNGDFVNARTFLTNAISWGATINSPMANGILERSKAMLLTNFYDEFNGVIDTSLAECIVKYKDYLSPYYGAYELDLPLVLKF